MAIPQAILDYLHEHCVTYSHEHRTPGRADAVPLTRNVATTVIFRVRDQLVMAILNEDRVIDMDEMKRLVGYDELAVPSEEELFIRFASRNPATIPPFATLFRVTLYCDRMLAQQPEIEFRAGTAEDTIRMAFSEFVQIEAPVMADFSNLPGSATTAA